MTFIDSLKKRRSQYNLGKDIGISDQEIKDILEDIIQAAPSPMNAQSARTILLLNENHDKLWDIVLESIADEIGKENVTDRTKKKIQGFKDAYGSILYYVDEDVIDGLIEESPSYAENFNRWADVENGMLQYAIWTALADMDIGASLQHYNPIIDQRLQEAFDIPENYQLLAQMPFGNIVEPAAKKDRLPIEKKFKVFE